MVSSKGKHHQNDQVRASARFGSRPNGLVPAWGSPKNRPVKSVGCTLQDITWDCIAILGDGYQSMFIGIYNIPTISNYDWIPMDSHFMRWMTLTIYRVLTWFQDVLPLNMEHVLS